MNPVAAKAVEEGVGAERRILRQRLAGRFARGAESKRQRAEDIAAHEHIAARAVRAFDDVGSLGNRSANAEFVVNVTVRAPTGNEAAAQRTVEGQQLLQAVGTDDHVGIDE